MHFLFLFSLAAKPEDIFIKLLGIQKFKKVIDSFCQNVRHVCQVNIIFCVNYTQKIDECSSVHYINQMQCMQGGDSKTNGGVFSQ